MIQPIFQKTYEYIYIEALHRTLLQETLISKAEKKSYVNHTHSLHPYVVLKQLILIMENIWEI